jgi:hypothetical protein
VVVPSVSLVISVTMVMLPQEIGSLNNKKYPLPDLGEGIDRASGRKADVNN